MNKNDYQNYNPFLVPMDYDQETRQRFSSDDDSPLARSIRDSQSDDILTCMKAHSELVRMANVEHVTHAYYAIGVVYMHGNALITRDVPLALEWFEAAASLGHVSALRAVSQFYKEGVVVEQDDNMALAYLASAALKGNDGAVWDILQYKGGLLSSSGSMEIESLKFDYMMDLAKKEVLLARSFIWQRWSRVTEEASELAVKWAMEEAETMDDSEMLESLADMLETGELGGKQRMDLSEKIWEKINKRKEKNCSIYDEDN